MEKQNEQKVKARNDMASITIPAAPPPKGSYLPALVVGDLVFTSGMGTIFRGERQHVGYVGDDITVEQAAEAARIATLNAVAALRDAAGGLQQVDRIVRVTGYVRSAAGFTGQTEVLNAGSDLLLELFGDRGHHVRSAVGVAELPFGIPVEIELIAKLHAMKTGDQQ
jgi:enamine deaminase RidA (YjgF/YER057c/UK114 family)